MINIKQISLWGLSCLWRPAFIWGGLTGKDLKMSEKNQNSYSVDIKGVLKLEDILFCNFCNKKDIRASKMQFLIDIIHKRPPSACSTFLQHIFVHFMTWIVWFLLSIYKMPFFSSHLCIKPNSNRSTINMTLFNVICHIVYK